MVSKAEVGNTAVSISLGILQIRLIETGGENERMIQMSECT